jgi:ribonuclease D
MTSPALPEPLYIRNKAQMRDVLPRLRDELARDPLLGVDTESNSMYAYRERVCLIQLSTRVTDYLVDPLSGVKIEPLGEFFEDSIIEKVFHAAEYDIICMKRDFSFAFNNLFDTMIASRVCGMKNFGYGALLSEILGIASDKSHQRDDWGRRPLPADSLLYAQMDTHYLPALRDDFARRLTEMNRWQDAREAFYELTLVDAARREFDPEGYWRLALPNQLTRRQSAVLRELYLLRDELARQRNLPTFKVMQDKLLLALAQVTPTSLAELEQVEGVGQGTLHRYGGRILAAVAAGKAARPPRPPAPEPPADPVVVERYTALREWRKTLAAERGIESDVIIPKDTLWLVAEANPRTLDDLRTVQGVTSWRLEQYGAAMLNVLRKAE